MPDTARKAQFRHTKVVKNSECHKRDAIGKDIVAFYMAERHSFCHNPSITSGFRPPTLTETNMQIQLKRLFAIDTFSLLLFAMVILGILDHLPSVTSIILQSIYVGVTVLLTVSFLRRRLIGLVILKIAMLLILYFLDTVVYII